MALAWHIRATSRTWRNAGSPRHLPVRRHHVRWTGCHSRCLGSRVAGSRQDRACSSTQQRRVEISRGARGTNDNLKSKARRKLLGPWFSGRARQRAEYAGLTPGPVLPCDLVLPGLAARAPARTVPARIGRRTHGYALSATRDHGAARFGKGLFLDTVRDVDYLTARLWAMGSLPCYGPTAARDVAGLVPGSWWVGIRLNPLTAASNCFEVVFPRQRHTAVR